MENTPQDNPGPTNLQINANNNWGCVIPFLCSNHDPIRAATLFTSKKPNHIQYVTTHTHCICKGNGTYVIHLSENHTLAIDLSFQDYFQPSSPQLNYFHDTNFGYSFRSCSNHFNHCINFLNCIYYSEKIQTFVEQSFPTFVSQYSFIVFHLDFCHTVLSPTNSEWTRPLLAKLFCKSV
jgi:hypothetical protein